jgi:glyoxylase-like metal-dependent hydrolase (beta-lactamase superfamily II)
MVPEEFPTLDTAVPELEPAELKRRIDAGDVVTVLDVRRDEEFAEWHIEGETVEITNLPFPRFLEDDSDQIVEQVPEGAPLVVLCAKGKASQYVAGRLKRAGRDIVHLDGGMTGWARLYDRVEITRYDGPGTVYQYQRPSSGCLAYLVVSGGEAAIIDPLRAFTDRYLDDATELGAELVYAFDTHIHADHISGVRALDDRGVTGVMPEASRPRDVTYIDEVETAADGETFTVGETTIDVRHTPGHTSDMTSYHLSDGLLATGDGLFVESVARPDLEAGDDGAPEAARQLYETVQQTILPLDDDLLVGGAHYSQAATPAEDRTYTATLGEIKSKMRVLSLEEDEFVDRILSDMPPRPANYERIIATNLGQETVDDEEAFELELGPNNCAASQDALTGD